MINVVFLGFGNLNHNLCNALAAAKNVRVKQIYNRNLIDFFPNKNIPFTNSLSEVMKADVYIVGIPDDAIAKFSEGLPFKDRLVVHTSGGVGMDRLSPKNRRGVFYPLQTFSKTRAVEFINIPICIESENPHDLELLHNLGNAISDKVVEISSEKRAKLHVAAVFVNNFVNHLYGIGSAILKEENLSFDLLKPLILETATKVQTLTPQEAQTGPAKRKDIKTIEKHLELLNDSEYREFYGLFTHSLKKSNFN